MFYSPSSYSDIAPWLSHNNHIPRAQEEQQDKVPLEDLKCGTLRKNNITERPRKENMYRKAWQNDRS